VRALNTDGSVIILFLLPHTQHFFSFSATIKQFLEILTDRRVMHMQQPEILSSKHHFSFNGSRRKYFTYIVIGTEFFFSITAFFQGTGSLDSMVD
jgi:hypothetical protein